MRDLNDHSENIPLSEAQEQVSLLLDRDGALLRADASALRGRVAEASAGEIAVRRARGLLERDAQALAAGESFTQRVFAESVEHLPRTVRPVQTPAPRVAGIHRRQRVGFRGVAALAACMLLSFIIGISFVRSAGGPATDTVVLQFVEQIDDDLADTGGEMELALNGDSDPFEAAAISYAEIRQELDAIERLLAAR